MGYTHYWTHSDTFTQSEWNQIEIDVKDILTLAVADGLELADAMGENLITPDMAIVKGTMIMFNGLGGLGHETFGLSMLHGGWDFCKTARKPYDVAVTAILAYLESAYPEKFSVGSDGDADDWKPAMALLKRMGTRAAFVQIPKEVRADS